MGKKLNPAKRKWLNVVETKPCEDCIYKAITIAEGKVAQEWCYMFRQCQEVLPCAQFVDAWTVIEWVLSAKAGSESQLFVWR